MSNSKLYQPPPPPPKRPAAPVDPLFALSKAPTMIAPARAEELTDLTDDEALEQWANSGTKVMPKSQMPQSQSQPQQVGAPTMVAAPLPSFYPVAYSTPPQIREKKTSAAIWVVPLALFVFAGGVVAAAAGWYVYHTSDLASASTADTSPNVIVPPAATETAPPAVTLTATTAPTVTATSTTTTTTTTRARTSATTTTSPSTTTTTSSSTGSLRTFAAGNGKPVYVDGKQVGFGGAKITTVCGRHNVSVGTGHARSIEIPCNGATLTVGTPDGT